MRVLIDHTLELEQKLIASRVAKSVCCAFWKKQKNNAVGRSQYCDCVYDELDRKNREINSVARVNVACKNFCQGIYDKKTSLLTRIAVRRTEYGIYADL